MSCVQLGPWASCPEIWGVDTWGVSGSLGLLYYRSFPCGAGRWLWYFS